MSLPEHKRMLYLASQSPRRRQLIRKLRRPFAVVRAPFRETIRKAQSPEQNALRNAVGKALRARVPKAHSGIVIAADTFLWFQGHILGKPRSLADAWRMMRALRGKSHWVYTGLCVRDLATGKHRASFDRSQVFFNPVDDRFIERMFAQVDPLDKAGAYAIQEDRGHLIRLIQGHKSTVIGLPLELLRRELRLLESGRAGRA